MTNELQVTWTYLQLNNIISIVRPNSSYIAVLSNFSWESVCSIAWHFFTDRMHFYKKHNIFIQPKLKMAHELAALQWATPQLNTPRLRCQDPLAACTRWSLQAGADWQRWPWVGLDLFSVRLLPCNPIVKWLDRLVHPCLLTNICSASSLTILEGIPRANNTELRI